MGETLIQMTGLAGSLPRISSISSGRVPAFWGAGQDMNARSSSPPKSWSSPGFLLRRPRVAFVGATWPSGPIPVDSLGNLALSSLASPLTGMTAFDIPGVKPPDFAFSQQNTFTGALSAANTDYYYPSFQAIPSPLKFPGVEGKPFVSSDFLYVLVASTFNNLTSVNVSQLIAQKPWFPQMSVRIFTPVPPSLISGSRSLSATSATAFANMISINSRWNSLLRAAVPELQAAGIDAQIVGTEADVTVEAVGKLIADHFHLSQ